MLIFCKMPPHDTMTLRFCEREIAICLKKNVFLPELSIFKPLLKRHGVA